MKRWGWSSLVVVGLALILLAGCRPSSVGASGGTTVSVTRVGTVSWLAVQDGSGAWQTLSGTTFTVNDTDGAFGVAWECTQSSGQPSIEIVQATTAEATTVTAPCGPSTPTAHTVSGTVSGIPSGGDAFIGLGDARALSAGTYTLSNAPSGAQTLLAYGEATGGVYGNLVRKTITVDGNLTENLNLSAGSPITTTRILTVTTVPSGELPILWADLAPAATPPAQLAVTVAPSLTYPLVPSALRQTGDEYVLVGGAGAACAGTCTPPASQGTILVSPESAAGGTALTVPPVLSSSAGVSVSGGRATATWQPVTFSGSGHLGFSTASVTPSSTSSARWEVAVTSGWMGGHVGYAFPDLSSTAGWQSSWGFPTVATATATVTAYHANVTLQQGLAFNRTQQLGSLPDGASLEFTERSATGTY